MAARAGFVLGGVMLAAAGSTAASEARTPLTCAIASIRGAIGSRRSASRPRSQRTARRGGTTSTFAGFVKTSKS
jgi:hypothetical protein